LKALPQTRCTWKKALPNEEVIAEMQRSDILLVPSRYEPGGIVVGEALACGMIVVASDEVGSAENLPINVCKRFPAGDRNAFAGAVAYAMEDVLKRGTELREEARRVAKEQFDPASMTRLLLSELRRLVGTRAGS
jgi:glycosyltransferase involved in cell wall biosynthesis